LWLESFQQLGHFHENWLRYGLAKEKLKREKYLRLARAGQYATASNPDLLFAETVEDLLANEIGLWVATERSKPPEPPRQPRKIHRTLRSGDIPAHSDTTACCSWAKLTESGSYLLEATWAPPGIRLRLFANEPAD
jgi:hypothetical protein